MKALQITAVIVSMAIFGATILYSHLSAPAEQSGETPQATIDDTCRPDITIKLSENAKLPKSDCRKPEKHPAHDLSLLHKYKNVGTLGHALSKEEYDNIQKNGNQKPPEDDKPRKSAF